MVKPIWHAITAKVRHMTPLWITQELKAAAVSAANTIAASVAKVFLSDQAT